VRRLAVVVVTVFVAAVAGAAVFERFLSQDRPEDRAILAYMAVDEAGKATSDDLADLGVLLLNKGFPQDAERYLERAVKLDKENAEARYRLGLVLQRQGKYRQAIKQYRKVAKLRPGHAYSRFMLALAEERAGHRDAAVYDYAKAYKHAPELADPAKNPLVLDSSLQLEAQLLRYRREVESDTIDVGAINPEAIREMMAVRPPAAAPPAPAEAQAIQQPGGSAARSAPGPAATPVPGPGFGKADREPTDRQRPIPTPVATPPTA